MRIVKPVLLAAVLGAVLAGAMAHATPPPPRVGETPDSVPRAAAKGAPQAGAGKGAPKTDVPQKKVPPKRRVVHQAFDGMPGVAPPVGVQPLPSPLAAPAPMTVIPGPTTFIPNGCQGASCSDSAGNRYQGGIGTTLIGPNGRLCSNNGITVQCF